MRSFVASSRNHEDEGVLCSLMIDAFQRNVVQFSAHVQCRHRCRNMHYEVVVNHSESGDIEHLGGIASSTTASSTKPSTVGGKTKVEAAGAATDGQGFRLFRSFKSQLVASEWSLSSSIVSSPHSSVSFAAGGAAPRLAASSAASCSPSAVASANTVATLSPKLFISACKI